MLPSSVEIDGQLAGQLDAVAADDENAAVAEAFGELAEEAGPQSGNWEEVEAGKVRGQSSGEAVHSCKGQSCSG